MLFKHEQHIACWIARLGDVVRGAAFVSLCRIDKTCLGIAAWCQAIGCYQPTRCMRQHFSVNLAVSL